MKVIFSVSNKYPFIKSYTFYFFNLMRNVYFFTKPIIRSWYIYVYKKFIDFLFFDLYRNRTKIKTFLNKILINFIRLLLVYFLLYKNNWGFVFNIFFSDLNDCFVWWDCSTPKGMLYIFITYLNIDNLIMLFYIFFIDVGLSNLFSSTYDSNFILLGFR